MKPLSVCPSCGASLSPDAERCDLCGTPLTDQAPAAPAPEDAFAEATQETVPPPAAPRPPAGPVACHVCERLNPADARFCNQCGAPLQPAARATAAPPVPAEAPLWSAAQTAAERSVPLPAPPLASVPEREAVVRPSSDPGRRALLLVGAGLAVVLVLYLVSQRSGPAGADPAAAEQPRLTAAPSSAPVAIPDSLRDRVAALEDEGTAASLDEAGGLLYRAAAALPPDDPQQPGQRTALAQQAVGLYERSLALEDDPDVRVNLAVASLLDPRNPMRMVQELQAVLTANPDHVEANFNMGLMRMQIGRLDAAAESFQRVIALTQPSDVLHGRATEALAAVEGAQSGAAPQGAPAPQGAGAGGVSG